MWYLIKIPQMIHLHKLEGKKKRQKAVYVDLLDFCFKLPFISGPRSFREDGVEQIVPGLEGCVQELVFHIHQSVVNDG